MLRPCVVHWSALLLGLQSPTPETKSRYFWFLGVLLNPFVYGTSFSSLKENQLTAGLKDSLSRKLKPWSFSPVPSLPYSRQYPHRAIMALAREPASLGSAPRPVCPSCGISGKTPSTSVSFPVCKGKGLNQKHEEQETCGTHAAFCSGS